MADGAWTGPASTTRPTLRDVSTASASPADVGTFGRTHDALGAYLRRMGTIELLTREREVEIAKRIEQGQRQVLTALFNSPSVVRHVIELGERLRAREVDVPEALLH